MKAIPNRADGSVSVTMHGDVVRVSERNIGAALTTLLDEIARLEERVDTLERTRNLDKNKSLQE
jgi:hypothetical protein